MTDQVFRSGKPVTARSIVSAAIAGDMTADEAVELVQLLIEARARPRRPRGRTPPCERVLAWLGQAADLRLNKEIRHAAL